MTMKNDTELSPLIGEARSMMITTAAATTTTTTRRRSPKAFLFVGFVAATAAVSGTAYWALLRVPPVNLIQLRNQNRNNQASLNTAVAAAAAAAASITTMTTMTTTAGPTKCADTYIRTIGCLLDISACPDQPSGDSGRDTNDRCTPGCEECLSPSLHCVTTDSQYTNAPYNFEKGPLPFDVSYCTPCDGPCQIESQLGPVE